MSRAIQLRHFESNVQTTNPVFQWTQKSEIAEMPKKMKIVMSIMLESSF